MVRATTPTLTLRVKDESVDLTQARNVYVTLEQAGGMSVTKTGEDLEVDERVVKVFLSQEESLGLAEGQPLEIQINWTYQGLDGRVLRDSTKKKAVNVSEQLLNEVIS